MNTGQQILFFVSLLGAFNGIVLSLYLFISKQTRSIAAFFLGVMLLAISIRVGKSVFFYFNYASFPKIILQNRIVCLFPDRARSLLFLQISINESSACPQFVEMGMGRQYRLHTYHRIDPSL